ncbi:hypothetical protein HPB50_004925 [Hyalomma asiaticum]|uniref:Uncharacterized protein n=1 Tax=Hyalomma asiaticum TaxID=266040 RepID=A0ACB7TCT0_HYAAI|nr:hypothetical protein HPB50_004925 [Hyalomma asiaticum]
MVGTCEFQKMIQQMIQILYKQDENDWTVRLGKWNEEDPKNLSKAKSRIRATLLRHGCVQALTEDDPSYRRFKIESRQYGTLREELYKRLSDREDTEHTGVSDVTDGASYREQLKKLGCCIKYPVSATFEDRTAVGMLADKKMAATLERTIRGAKGPSPLVNVPGFDTVWSFCLDYMDAVLLGVIRQIRAVVFRHWKIMLQWGTTDSKGNRQTSLEPKTSLVL